jgi:hypothetical protein
MCLADKTMFNVNQQPGIYSILSRRIIADGIARYMSALRRG